MKTSDQLALAALIVTGVLSLAAIVVSVISYRGARKHAKKSADAADRSATAAEEALALQRAEAEKYVPSWEITHMNKAAYQLANRCGEKAVDVHLSADELVLRAESIPEIMANGETGRFVAMEAQQMSDRRVTVNWRRPDTGEEYSLSYALPK